MESEVNHIAKALVEFIPVLGGALIGIAGGLVGTNYAHRLATTNDNRNLKRSKLEELVAECYELDVWLKKLDNYFLFGGPEVIEQSPISRI
jgi:hypothetical protein